MPKLQTLIRTARGIFTNFNNVNSIPEGGLLECQNAEIDRPGVLSKTRGRIAYGAAPYSYITTSMFEYKGRLHVQTQYSTGYPYYDSDGAGTWASAGTFIKSPTETLETKIRSVEIFDNAYFTSMRGICRKTALGGSFQPAGMVPVWEQQCSLTGTGAGMFEVDSQVAYRSVRVRKIGTREYVSAPTRRTIIANPKYTGLSFTNVTGTITVTHNAHGYSNSDIIEISDSSDTAQVANGPKTISGVAANSYQFTATGAGAGGTLSDGKKFNVSIVFCNGDYDNDLGDTIRVYRTEFSSSQSVDPGDEMYLCFEYVRTNAVTETKTDSIEEAFLGDPLYTNGSIQGIANSNDSPPFARDVALWKGHLWLSHIKWPHRLEIQLDSISGLVDGTSTVTVNDVGGSTERTFTFNTTEDESLRYFKRFTGEPTQAQNVKKTAESFVRVFNGTQGFRGDRLVAKYASEANDHPGKIVIEGSQTTTATAIAIGKIQIKVNNSTTGSKFTPILPTTYDGTVESDTEEQQNGLAHSKYDLPDAVPRSNWDPCGAQNKKILRILALRDSLIIVKEDGIYRCSGETDGLAGDEFTISQLDPSIQAIAPHTWVVINNSVVGLSTQGVVRVDETGTEILSSSVEDQIKQLIQVADYAMYTHAIAYESDRKYILYYRPSAANTYATKCLVFNYLTETWTSRTRVCAAAFVLTTDDRLYEANESYLICRERKAFSAADFCGESLSTTLTSNSTTTWEGQTVSTVQTPAAAEWEAVGNLFEHNSQEANVVAYNAGVVTLDKLLACINGNACTWSLGIASRIRWRPESCQNAGVMKQFTRIQLYFEALQALRHKVAIYSDENLVESFLADIVQSASSSKQLLSIMVPRKMQRCRALHVVYEHNRAKEDFDILNVAFTFRSYGDLTSRDPR